MKIPLFRFLSIHLSPFARGRFSAGNPTSQHPICRYLLTLLLSAILLLYPLILPGCTMIGFAVGSAIDAGKPRSASITGVGVSELHFRDEITIRTQRDSILTAKFLRADSSGDGSWTMTVWARDSVLKFPADSLKSVNISQNHYAKWYGLGIGAALDAAIITAVAVAFSHLRFGAWQ